MGIVKKINIQKKENDFEVVEKNLKFKAFQPYNLNNNFVIFKGDLVELIKMGDLGTPPSFQIVEGCLKGYQFSMKLLNASKFLERVP